MTVTSMSAMDYDVQGWTTATGASSKSSTTSTVAAATTTTSLPPKFVKVRTGGSRYDRNNLLVVQTVNRLYETDPSCVVHAGAGNNELRKELVDVDQTKKLDPAAQPASKDSHTDCKRKENKKKRKRRSSEHPEEDHRTSRKEVKTDGTTKPPKKKKAEKILSSSEQVQAKKSSKGEKTATQAISVVMSRPKRSSKSHKSHSSSTKTRRKSVVDVHESGTTAHNEEVENGSSPLARRMPPIPFLESHFSDDSPTTDNMNSCGKDDTQQLEDQAIQNRSIDNTTVSNISGDDVSVARNCSPVPMSISPVSSRANSQSPTPHSPSYGNNHIVLNQVAENCSMTEVGIYPGSQMVSQNGHIYMNNYAYGQAYLSSQGNFPTSNISTFSPFAPEQPAINNFHFVQYEYGHGYVDPATHVKLVQNYVTQPPSYTPASPIPGNNSLSPDYGHQTPMRYFDDRNYNQSYIGSQSHALFSNAPTLLQQPQTFGTVSMSNQVPNASCIPAINQQLSSSSSTSTTQESVKNEKHLPVSQLKKKPTNASASSEPKKKSKRPRKSSGESSGDDDDDLIDMMKDLQQRLPERKIDVEEPQPSTSNGIGKTSPKSAEAGLQHSGRSIDSIHIPRKPYPIVNDITDQHRILWAEVHKKKIRRRSVVTESIRSPTLSDTASSPVPPNWEKQHISHKQEGPFKVHKIEITWERKTPYLPDNYLEIITDPRVRKRAEQLKLIEPSIDSEGENSKKSPDHSENQDSLKQNGKMKESVEVKKTQPKIKSLKGRKGNIENGEVIEVVTDGKKQISDIESDDDFEDRLTIDESVDASSQEECENPEDSTNLLTILQAQYVNKVKEKGVPMLEYIVVADANKQRKMSLENGVNKKSTTVSSAEMKEKKLSKKSYIIQSKTSSSRKSRVPSMSHEISKHSSLFDKSRVSSTEHSKKLSTLSPFAETSVLEPMKLKKHSSSTKSSTSKSHTQSSSGKSSNSKSSKHTLEKSLNNKPSKKHSSSGKSSNKELVKLCKHSPSETNLKKTAKPVGHSSMKKPDAISKTNKHSLESKTTEKK